MSDQFISPHNGPESLRPSRFPDDNPAADPLLSRLVDEVNPDADRYFHQYALTPLLPPTSGECRQILFNLMTEAEETTALHAGIHLFRSIEFTPEEKLQLLDDVIASTADKPEIRDHCHFLKRLVSTELPELRLDNHLPPAISLPLQPELEHRSLSLFDTEDLLEIISSGEEGDRLDAASAIGARMHLLPPGQLLALNEAGIDYPDVRKLLRQLAFENQQRVTTVRVIAYNADNPYEVIVREGASKEWSLPGGKRAAVTLPKALQDATRKKQMEAPIESLLREGADEVSRKMFKHLHEIRSQTAPLAILVTPSTCFLKKKWELLGNQSDGLIEYSPKKWEILHPWTQIYLMPFQSFNSRTKEGRKVKTLNIEKTTNLRGIRPAHSEVLQRFRNRVKDARGNIGGASRMSPFVVYSKNEK